jgi:peptidyl-prolyl cis-trans isomerase A (cyclophilin A)
LTVANFLNYVNNGDYRTSIFHRREPNSPPVLQGGGFTFAGDGVQPTAISPDPPVEDEVGRPNTRGTIAMAKSGSPDSATSQFFFNLVDNSAVLSPQQQTNGGFTVFGDVVGNGMTIVDDLAALPTPLIGTGQGGVFNQIPLIDFPQGGTFPNDAVRANYAIVNDVVLTQRRDGMTFAVVGNTNPSLVNATIVGSTLTLDYQPNQSGTAIITIQATDRDGGSTQTTVAVTVGDTP